MSNLNCKKCGNTNWGVWTSARTGKIHYYCRSCRCDRANAYTQRKSIAVGHHTQNEWLNKLGQYDVCPGCNRPWVIIPKRADKRYKYVWTKDHIIPLGKGGRDDIDNLQPLCYQCNFGKR